MFIKDDRIEILISEAASANFLDFPSQTVSAFESD
jgi:hypothetical protein